jgi:hypothetical protein
MDTLSTQSTTAEPRPASPEAAAAGSDLLNAAAIWTDLLGFWTGRWAEEPEGLSAAAVRTCRRVIEINQSAAVAMYGAAQQQQDLVFASARAALSVLESAATTGAEQQTTPAEPRTKAAARR